VDTVFVQRRDVHATSAMNAFLALARPQMPALAIA
jgi:hypothetical protein